MARSQKYNFVRNSGLQNREILSDEVKREDILEVAVDEPPLLSFLCSSFFDEGRACHSIKRHSTATYQQPSLLLF